MKVAIIFKGGISKRVGNLLNPGEINSQSEFVNFQCAYNSFKKHIIEANSQHDIDTFIHCWHPELENIIEDLYKPQQIITEDNSRYNANILYKLAMSNCPRSCFSVVSQVLSLKKGCEMVKKHCEKNNFKYDLVLIYRLDLLLIEDMIFDDYDLKSITCNNWADLKGDFHFVMSYENMIKFGQMYDHFSNSFRPIAHQYAKQYVQEILKVPYVQDNIAAGKDQEVVRKAIIFVQNFNRTFDELEKYGITKEEILSYNV